MEFFVNKIPVEFSRLGIFAVAIHFWDTVLRHKFTDVSGQRSGLIFKRVDV
jgi:hypothetical protein